jgi:hypothetical protein
VVAEIVAVDGCGVLKGGVADVDVAVFDKTGKCSFVHLGPVLVWHWSNGHCGLIGDRCPWLVVGVLMAFGHYSKSSSDFATFNEVEATLPLHKMWHHFATS